MKISILFFIAFAAELAIAESMTNDEKVIEFIKSNCDTCHAPLATKSDLVAPPMIAVKRHYLDSGLNREQFIEAFAAFVAEPTVENTLMPDAVRRFGLMPRLPYDEKILDQVAAYIYDNEIRQPEWFEDHYRNSEASRRNGRGDTARSPAERGRDIANVAKAQLSKNILSALGSGGAAHAVSFCNEQAIPITRTMASNHGVSIRRVSDRPRNPANKANAAETVFIDNFQTMIYADEPILPLVMTQGSTTTVYLPIVTNAVCLQCHGTVDTTIQSDTLARIQALYPADKATGYGENEVRGIWQIRWED